MNLETCKLVVMMLIGWWLTMVYPTDPSLGSTMVSMFIGTFGVFLAISAAYCLGFNRGRQ